MVNELGLEDYVRGVVANELSPGGYPAIEALKAQAVAARHTHSRIVVSLWPRGLTYRRRQGHKSIEASLQRILVDPSGR